MSKDLPRLVPPAIFSMQYTELELTQRIKSRLGAGRRILEFSEQTSSGEFDHLAEAIDQALDLFNKYLFRTEYAFIAESTNENVTVDFSGDDELLRVVRVDFTKPSEISAGQEDVFSLAARLQGGGYYGGYGGRHGRMAPAGRYGFGDIAFWKHHDEAVSRITSTDPDWIWDEDNRRLVLTMPGGGYEVTYQKAYAHTLATLPNNYVHDFLKVAEGYARIILAEIRGKFGTQIPGPTGGTTTDADIQRNRGETLIREVEEQLQKLPLNALPEFG